MIDRVADDLLDGDRIVSESETVLRLVINTPPVGRGRALFPSAASASAITANMEQSNSAEQLRRAHQRLLELNASPLHLDSHTIAEAPIEGWTRGDPRLKGVMILPLSGGQMIVPVDRVADGSAKAGDQRRRRIEIRLRRSTGQAKSTGVTANHRRAASGSQVRAETLEAGRRLKNGKGVRRLSIWRTHFRPTEQLSLMASRRLCHSARLSF